MSNDISIQVALRIAELQEEVDRAGLRITLKGRPSRRGWIRIFLVNETLERPCAFLRISDLSLFENRKGNPGELLGEGRFWTEGGPQPVIRCHTGAAQ